MRTLKEAGCRGCGYYNCRAPVQAQQDGGGAASWVNRSNDENSFLEHDITARRRYGHVFRDLEYALQVREGGGVREGHLVGPLGGEVRGGGQLAHALVVLAAAAAAAMC